MYLPLRTNIASLSNTYRCHRSPQQLNGKVSANHGLFIRASELFHEHGLAKLPEPEQTFTYFSQTVTTAMHFFFSSAVGIAVAAVLVRTARLAETDP